MHLCFQLLYLHFDVMQNTFNYKKSDVTFVFNAVSIIGSITLKESSWDSIKTTSVGEHLTKMSTFLKIMHSSTLMFNHFPFSKLSSSLEILNGFESLNVTGLRYCCSVSWSSNKRDGSCVWGAFSLKIKCSHSVLKQRIDSYQKTHKGNKRHKMQWGAGRQGADWFVICIIKFFLKKSDPKQVKNLLNL